MREKHEYKTIVHPLRPLFDRQSRILILGSFPSIKTREMNFFRTSEESVLEDHGEDIKSRGTFCRSG